MKNLLYLLLFLPLVSFAQAESNTNISVISSERTSILYRGFHNPIKIAVPNAKSFTATAQGLTKIDSLGNYDFNVTGVSGNEATIKIKAVMNDGNTLNESKTFEVRDIKHQLARINGENCSGCIVVMTKEKLRNAVITISLGDPSFDSRQTVNSFEIYIPKAQNIVIEGNIITEKAFKYIDNLEPGDELFITNITHSSNGEKLRMKSAPPIRIQIRKE